MAGVIPDCYVVKTLALHVDVMYTLGNIEKVSGQRLIYGFVQWVCCDQINIKNPVSGALFDNPSPPWYCISLSDQLLF